MRRQCQLLTDRFPQPFIRADQLQTEHGRSVQPKSRTTGERATCATIPTAVVDVAGPVIFDVHPLATATAADSTGQQIFPSTPARDTPSIRSSELFGRNDRFVLTGIPLTVQEHFAEIDA